MLRRYVDPSALDEEIIPSIYGPMLIGVFCSMILYGILVAQVYNYHVTYKNDLRIVRYLVLYLFVMETIHSVCAMFMLYQPLITNFGRESAQIDIPKAMPAEPITTVLISTPIQIFIAWRIWRIQNSLWIPSLICVLAATSGAGGLWTGIKETIIRVYAKSPQAYPAVYMWLFSAAAADILITGSLAIILSGRKTGIQASDAVISRIIVFTIQTGLVTSIAAIADVVLLLAVPHITLSFLFDVSLVKIYAITLMSTLNTRESLNKNWDNQHSFLFDPAIGNEASPANAPMEVLTVAEPMVFKERTTVLDLEGQKTVDFGSTMLLK